jgi:hypothetical protein
VAEHLSSRHEALEFDPQHHKVMMVMIKVSFKTPGLRKANFLRAPCKTSGSHLSDNN